MPHKDANQGPADGPPVQPAAVEPEARPAVLPPTQPTPGPLRGMAKVLERATALDLVPPVVKRGDRPIDTATYISECADIARHPGPWAADRAAYPWINPQET